MTDKNHSQLLLTVALTAVAGCVDGIGYLRLRHFFVSFMSGDSTQLAVSAVDGDWRRASTAGAIVALFVAGVVAGRSIYKSLEPRGRPVVLLIEALLLVLAAVTGKSTLSILAPMVIAMGVQNAAIDKEHATRMGLSYVTGTLVSFGDKLADALRPHGPARWAWAPHRLHWGALVLGAICGALGYRDWGASALLAPACAAAVLAGITAVTGA